MNTLFTAAFLLISSLLVAEGARWSVFDHIDSRLKKINQGEHHIILTGREYGLMLQCPKEAKISFPKAKSAVVAPNGKRINLKFESREEMHAGIWIATFDPSHEMIEGHYHYTVTIMIDGVRRTFDHDLKYSFENIEANHSRTTQR